MIPKSVLIFTATRAEFGILKPLILALQAEKEINLRLAVGGTHLSKEHGETLSEIINLGLSIDVKLDFVKRDKNETNIAISLAQAITETTNYLTNEKPDVAIILGDRFEALGFGLACYCLGVPIAHIHGGELTYGALDDGFRHCLTKIASIHFAASGPYRNRIIQMGAHPSLVHDVGPLSRDNVISFNPLSSEALWSKIGMSSSLPKKAFVALHPETKLTSKQNLDMLESLINVLTKLEELFVFVSYANNDPDGNSMNERLRVFAAENPQRVCLRPSFGQELFYNSIWASDFIIGNSSSGIIEAPFLGTPTINIGLRQSGRDFPSSVLSVGRSESEIEAAVIKVLENGVNFCYQHQGYDTRASDLIIQVIKNFDGRSEFGFYDLVGATR